MSYPLTEMNSGSLFDMKFKQILLSLVLLVPLTGYASYGTDKVSVSHISTAGYVSDGSKSFFLNERTAIPAPASVFTSAQARKMLPANRVLRDTRGASHTPAKHKTVKQTRKPVGHNVQSKAQSVGADVTAWKTDLQKVKQNISLYNVYKNGYSAAGNERKARMISAASRYQKTLNRYKRNILLEKFRSWEGVRYQWGGATRKGIDCSALVQKFARGLDVELPRTTGQQVKVGKKIRKKELRPGDLVFFWTSPVQRHVGIYVGKSEFIHASSSKGVTRSSLNNSYWKARYETSVRVTA